MKFPHTPVGVDHKFGGKIVTVHGVAHKTDTPKGGQSRDYWFFDCDVQWDDSGKISRTEVEPFKLCANGGGANLELQALNAAMDKHLRDNGEWRETAPRGWYAHRKVKAAA